MATKKDKTTTEVDKSKSSGAVPVAGATTDQGVKSPEGGVEAKAASAEVAAPPTLSAPQVTDIPVVSQWPGVLIVRNVPSGRVYRWPHAGATEYVDPQDIDTLRERNTPGAEGCCGTNAHQKIIIP